MLRRSFLKALGTLAAIAGVSWAVRSDIDLDDAELAHHRPDHDRGPGWRDPLEDDEPEEPVLSDDPPNLKVMVDG